MPRPRRKIRITVWASMFARVFPRRYCSCECVKSANGAQAATASWNYLTDDLYGEVAKGNVPTQDLTVLTMKASEFAKLSYNLFDDSKEWLDVPFKKVGELVLNKVPDNLFEWTEPSAFAPSNMVPGIEASHDRMLQGRLFSYADTQRYRNRANALQLPVNRPRAPVVNNYQGGQLDHGTLSLDVIYFPAATAAKTTAAGYRQSTYKVDAVVDEKPVAKTANFAQAGAFYRALKEYGQGGSGDEPGGRPERRDNGADQDDLGQLFLSSAPPFRDDAGGSGQRADGRRDSRRVGILRGKPGAIAPLSPR